MKMIKEDKWEWLVDKRCLLRNITKRGIYAGGYICFKDGYRCFYHEIDFNRNLYLINDVIQ